jgi:hypothetical protein
MFLCAGLSGDGLSVTDRPADCKRYFLFSNFFINENAPAPLNPVIHFPAGSAPHVPATNTARPWPPEFNRPAVQKAQARVEGQPGDPATG